MLGVVGLDDAVDDGEAEAGSTLEAGLKGLENLFDELRRNAGAGVLKTDAPVALELVECDGEGSAVRAWRGWRCWRDSRKPV